MKACEIIYPAAVFVCCSQRGENEFDLAGCWCCSLTAVRPARLSCAQLMYTQLLTLSHALSRSLETLHIRPLTLSPLFISSEAHYPPVIPRFGGFHHLNLPRKICHNVNNSLDFHAFDNSQVHKKVLFLCFCVFMLTKTTFLIWFSLMTVRTVFSFLEQQSRDGKWQALFS